jgi:hypothetical protein
MKPVSRRALSLLGVMLLSSAVVASGSDGRAGQAPPAPAPPGERAGCRQPISALPGVTRTWVAEREAGTAYVAWCARQIRQELVYDLVVAAASRAHPWASCPSHIRLALLKPSPELRVRLLPRDLPYPMTLNDFWYFRDGDDGAEQESRLETAAIPHGPAIDYGAGDAGQLLLCRGNRWIMGGYH